MTVQDKLKQIAESLGVPFVFEDWTLANVEIDRTPLPAVVYVLPCSGELDFKMEISVTTRTGCWLS